MPLSLQWSMTIKVLRSREAMEELGSCTSERCKVAEGGPCVALFATAFLMAIS